MKKYKKAFKKMHKKIIVIVMILALLINYIIPITNVFADSEYILSFTASGDHTLETDGIRLIIDEQYVELRNGSEEAIGTVECTSTKACTITVTNGQGGKLNYNSANKFTLYMQGHPADMNFEYSANEAIAVQDYVQQGPAQGEEPGEEHHFDGRAVVLWSCGSGDTGVCFHEFSVIDPEHCDPNNPTDACNPEIGAFDDGNSTFFRNTDITADNKSNTHFNVNAKYREWYLTDEFYKWQDLYRLANGMEANEEISWDTLDPRLIMGDPNQNIGQLEEAVTAANYCNENEEMEDCVNRYAATENHEIWTHELQPVGEPNETNAYVSYGDRNFKVVIYNSEYKGVSTTADFGGLHYYPASWADAYTRTDQYDVSATDENHPTYLQSILLENTVNLDILPYNGYEIDTIEALDIPADAVAIQEEAKQNPEDNQQFKIVFSSNFYDHVVFKLTDTNGGESYIQIKRYTIDGWIRDGHTLTADFYFKNTESYEDFIITAKVIYYDGTIENVTLEAVDHFRDSLGNPIDSYEADQEETIGPFKGKGLKQSVFEYNLGENADRNVKEIYLNAEYKGNNPNVYPGAYSGSGEGTPANLFHPEEVDQ